MFRMLKRFVQVFMRIERYRNQIIPKLIKVKRPLPDGNPEDTNRNFKITDKELLFTTLERFRHLSSRAFSEICCNFYLWRVVRILMHPGPKMNQGNVKHVR
ncbi:hypothetical protein NPIL_115791 [Nephila pilipes]|uniref:Uncharacterized protein n=1 Tax=Nephila pilipes TaxID=299642 RepID=A0A8X6P9W6_NEPPI|nr:hypothetical protein NPIL_115791 [Nephila pilipes]